MEYFAKVMEYFLKVVGYWIFHYLLHLLHLCLSCILTMQR